MTKKAIQEDRRIIALNRSVRHHYTIEEIIEAGIVLYGSEVKSLRDNKANIKDAYVEVEDNECVLLNAYIAPYGGANQFNHSTTRKRKLLLKRREINKLAGKTQAKGFTAVPLSLYFNKKNRVKIEIALVKGKKLHDKRETEKKRDWDREKSRILKEKH